MDEKPLVESFAATTPQFVDLPSPKKVSGIFAFFSLLVILVVAAAISFGAGVLASEFKQNRAGSGKITNAKGTTNTSGDSTLFSDKENAYSISYPKSWKSTAHSGAEPAGLKISHDDTSVELWLKIDKVIALSAEQKKALKSTKTNKAEVAEQASSVTTYEYKAGNFLIVITTNAIEETPQVTFWINAADASTKDQALGIVKTFKFI